MPRRSFLRFGAVALAQAGIGFAAARAAEPEAPAARFLLEWGKRGKEPGQFNFPIGIAISPSDEILITDSRNKRVQKFTTEGKFLASFPIPGEWSGGIALDKDGNIFVVSLTLNKVTVYSPEGKPLREWGKKGTGDGELAQPGDIVVAKDGSIYVSDQENRRVQHLTLEGRFLSKWGEYGVKEGQFGGNIPRTWRTGGPNFLALDSKGNVFTTEASVGRVQKFTAAGKFLLAWGDNKVKPGSFGGLFSGFKDRESNLQGPVGICVDNQDRVWVSAVCGRIQQFNADGKYLRGFGEEGTKPSQFYAPHGVALDSKGRLYVVDAFNHRIQKFAV